MTTDRVQLRLTPTIMISIVATILIISMTASVLIRDKKSAKTMSTITDIFENISSIGDSQSTVYDDTNIEPEVTYVFEEELIPVIDINADTSLNYSRKHIEVDEDLEKIILMTEPELWSYLSDGVFTDYPKQAFKNIEGQLRTIYANHQTKIEVPVWYWEDPNDETNFNKITKYKTFTVHDKVAPLYEAIFNDIYEDPTKPIINIADTAMGTWVIRGKNHNRNKTLSGHSMGTAIDINPSTGTFNIQGKVYGNGYRNKKMPRALWEQLPESHKKYNVLYDGCPIVEIFKSYGFYWGGDWKSGTDPMHLAFLGDGGKAREVGQQNYTNRKH